MSPALAGGTESGIDSGGTGWSVSTRPTAGGATAIGGGNAGAVMVVAGPAEGTATAAGGAGGGVSCGSGRAADGGTTVSCGTGRAADGGTTVSCGTGRAADGGTTVSCGTGRAGGADMDCGLAASVGRGSTCFAGGGVGFSGLRVYKSLPHRLKPLSIGDGGIALGRLCNGRSGRDGRRVDGR